MVQTLVRCVREMDERNFDSAEELLAYKRRWVLPWIKIRRFLRAYPYLWDSVIPERVSLVRHLARCARERARNRRKQETILPTWD